MDVELIEAEVRSNSHQGELLLVTSWQGQAKWAAGVVLEELGVVLEVNKSVSTLVALAIGVDLIDDSKWKLRITQCIIQQRLKQLGLHQQTVTRRWTQKPGQCALTFTGTSPENRPYSKDPACTCGTDRREIGRTVGRV